MKKENKSWTCAESCEITFSLSTKRIFHDANNRLVHQFQFLLNKQQKRQFVNCEPHQSEMSLMSIWSAEISIVLRIRSVLCLIHHAVGWFREGQKGELERRSPPLDTVSKYPPLLLPSRYVIFNLFLGFLFSPRSNYYTSIPFMYDVDISFENGGSNTSSVKQQW